LAGNAAAMVAGHLARLFMAAPPANALRFTLILWVPYFFVSLDTPLASICAAHAMAFGMERILNGACK